METESLTPDPEESAMRDLAAAVDTAERRPTDTVETPEPETLEEAPATEPQQPELPEQETPEQPQPEITPEEQLGRDIKTGQFKKSERPDTEYSRAQKEEIRSKRTWQNIQAEKEQHRLEVAQWEEQRRMEQLEAARQNYQPVKREGLTAQEYYMGAQRFEQTGDYENALKAYKVASELGQAEQQRYGQFQQADQEYQWRTQLQQVGQVEPRVFDPTTPIGNHVQRIVNGNPWLYNVPGGFLRAAEFAHMLTQVEQMKEKDDEIIQLKAELEKSRRRGQPARGGYSTPRTGDKEFDEMNLDEMEAHLRGVTSEADHWR